MHFPLMSIKRESIVNSCSIVDIQCNVSSCMFVTTDGSHPFYVQVMEDGSSHGVFLRNSNGMDIDLNPTSLVYKVIGGTCMQ